MRSKEERAPARRARRSGTEVSLLRAARYLSVHPSPYVLGLDLGREGGAVLIDPTGRPVYALPYDLGADPGAAFGAWWRFLSGAIRPVSAGLVVAYERPARHRTVSDAHAIGGYRAMVLACCHTAGVPAVEIAVSTVKATAGSGRADKDYMLAAARKRAGSLDIATHNVADALFVGLAARLAFKPPAV